MDDIKKPKTKDEDRGPKDKDGDKVINGNDPKQEPPQPKKLIGTSFWIMLFIVIIKDLIDVVADFSVVFSVIAPITGFIVTLILWFYYYLSGVKASTKTVSTFVITSIIGLIPFINLLPETALNLILTRTFENNQKLQRVAKLVSVKSTAKSAIEAV